MTFIPQTSLWAIPGIVARRRANGAKAAHAEEQRQQELKKKRKAELEIYHMKQAQRTKEIQQKIVELVGDQNAHCIFCGEYYTSWTGYYKGASDVSQPKIQCYCCKCQRGTDVYGHRKTAYPFTIHLYNDNDEHKKVEVIAFTNNDAINLALSYEDNGRNGWYYAFLVDRQS